MYLKNKLKIMLGTTLATLCLFNVSGSAAPPTDMYDGDKCCYKRLFDKTFALLRFENAMRNREAASSFFDNFFKKLFEVCTVYLYRKSGSKEYYSEFKDRCQNDAQERRKVVDEISKWICNEVDSSGQNILHCLVSSGNPILISTFLDGFKKNGFDLSAAWCKTDKEGKIPSEYIEGRDEERILLAKGAPSPITVYSGRCSLVRQKGMFRDLSLSDADVFNMFIPDTFGAKNIPDKLMVSMRSIMDTSVEKISPDALKKFAEMILIESNKRDTGDIITRLMYQLRSIMDTPGEKISPDALKDFANRVLAELDKIDINDKAIERIRSMGATDAYRLTKTILVDADARNFVGEFKGFAKMILKSADKEDISASFKSRAQDILTKYGGIVVTDELKRHAEAIVNSDVAGMSSDEYNEHATAIRAYLKAKWEKEIKVLYANSSGHVGCRLMGSTCSEIVRLMAGDSSLFGEIPDLLSKDCCKKGDEDKKWASPEDIDVLLNELLAKWDDKEDCSVFLDIALYNSVRDIRGWVEKLETHKADINVLLEKLVVEWSHDNIDDAVDYLLSKGAEVKDREQVMDDFIRGGHFDRVYWMCEKFGVDWSQLLDRVVQKYGFKRLDEIKYIVEKGNLDSLKDGDGNRRLLQWASQHDDLLESELLAEKFSEFLVEKFLDVEDLSSEDMKSLWRLGGIVCDAYVPDIGDWDRKKLAEVKEALRGEELPMKIEWQISLVEEYWRSKDLRDRVDPGKCEKDKFWGKFRDAFRYIPFVFKKKIKKEKEDLIEKRRVEEIYRSLDDCLESKRTLEKELCEARRTSNWDQIRRATDSLERIEKREAELSNRLYPAQEQKC